jgi:formate dehydrogenase major subunit
MPTLYRDRFATRDGRARLTARPYLLPGEQPDAAFPYLLVTGRRAEQYNSGSMTRRTGNARLLDSEPFDIGPADAAALGVSDGEPIELVSRHGRAVISPTRSSRARSSPASTSRPQASTPSPRRSRTR